MPKTKKDRVSGVLHKFNSGRNYKIFEMHTEGVYCTVCACVLRSVTSWTLESHLTKLKHQSNAKLKLSQTQITTCITQQPVTNFAHDLVETFLAADIPLNKLSDPKIQWLFQTYAKENVPSVSTARTRYLKDIYDEKLTKMKEDLAGKKLWVSFQPFAVNHSIQLNQVHIG